MTILVTGGSGYIGSHTVLELLNARQRVIILDNLSNSSSESLKRVTKITGLPVAFVRGDIRDSALLDELFSKHDISAVVHFAGLKSVSESVENPLKYYDNNVNGTLALVKSMYKAGVFKLVFSSSATVYGAPQRMPITEEFTTGCTTNPYGTSKLMVEQILQDVCSTDDRWSIALLRYFNPVGAHESGLLGEEPNGIPNNLLPYICQVAVGRLKNLSVFGDDYPTVDGTGVRDYIHVTDLALGHLRALERLASHIGLNVYNLGTGKGYSVLEMINAFERASGQSIPYTISPRRPGDIAECWSDPTKALKELGWRAERDLDVMMNDAWRWQIKNPDGYKS